MSLSERKKRILQAIINDYINTADPVGSRAIAKRHELGLSSATIRNEMADLEELGYLEQPHTSAGRIPSNRGYRFYVDQLMNKYSLTVKEISEMKYAMKLKIKELDKMINDYSKIVSQFTNYTTVVMSPQMKKSIIKHLQLVPIDEHNILLVMVTNTGVVKNKNIKIINYVEKGVDLNRITNILNDKLSGLTLEEITLSKIKEIHSDMKVNRELLELVLEVISEGIEEIDREDLFLSGAANILNLPEYQDVNKAKEFLSFLDKKPEICKLLTGSGDNKGIKILIGEENEIVEMQNCSLVVSKYSIGDKVIGKIGIIGPTRMEYAKVISSLEYLTENLNYLLMKFFFDGNND